MGLCNIWHAKTESVSHPKWLCTYPHWQDHTMGRETVYLPNYIWRLRDWVPLRSRHFQSQNLFTLSQEHPFVCRKWMLLLTHSWYVQSSAVIKQSNMVRYCMNDCRNSIRCWIQKSTPYLTLMGELWGAFCEYFLENWPCYNPITLYLCLMGSKCFWPNFEIAYSSHESCA